MARDIYVDVKQLHTLKLEMRILGQEEVPKAISAAVNRTITSTAAQISRVVRETYQVKAGDIKSTIKQKKSNKSDLIGEIVSTGRLLTLYHHFKIAPRKRTKRKYTVKATIKKGQQQSIPGAFLGSRRATGTPQVWMREGKSRYPIKVLRSLSVPQMISNEKNMDRIQAHAQKVLDERIEHELDFRIGKMARGRKGRVL